MFLLILLTFVGGFNSARSQELNAAQYGTVYFYRVEEVGRLDSRATTVNLEGKKFFGMPESRYVGFLMPPGKYGLKQRQKQSEFQLTVEAGKTVYVRVSQTGAGFGYNQAIILMQPEQALYQMRDMKPLDKSNIKIGTFQVLREMPAVQ
jgi:hypothetical protein